MPAGTRKAAARCQPAPSSNIKQNSPGKSAAAWAKTTVIHIKLDGKDLPAKDLEAFLPALGINVPKGASLQAGTLNADLNLNGPINKLVTTGTMGLFNGKLAGFDLGSKMSAISALTGVQTG